MNMPDIKIGLRVKTNVAFSGVPKDTEGIIVEDYGTGIVVAWDKPDRPIPKGHTAKQIAEMPAVRPDCPLRDGFDKDTELNYLEKAE